MGPYLVGRGFWAVMTIFGIVLVTFLIVRVTGDPSRFVLGVEATPDVVAEFRAEHGLDRPVWEQFWRYLAASAHGNFGSSLRYKEPVLQLFLERLPATLELGASAYGVAVVVGVVGGVYAAVSAGSPADRTAQVLVLIGQAIPGFYLGLLLILLVSVGLGWFPTGGRGGFSHLVLPTFTLSAYLTALIFRFARSSMLDVLHQDYIRTARAKGIRMVTVIWKHAVRNAMIPLLTVLALQSSVLFSGAVVTETVFSWPGVGRLVVDALLTRDYPLVQATVAVVTTFVVILNLLVDLAYAYLDPRIRYA
ncbi:MAG TPA: ABC transporter permease [bacterium]|nr:ABC transporter permease [bacterium]